MSKVVIRISGPGSGGSNPREFAERESAERESTEREFIPRGVRNAGLFSIAKKLTDFIASRGIDIERLSREEADKQTAIAVSDFVFMNEENCNTFFRSFLAGDHSGINWFYDVDFLETLKVIEPMLNAINLGELRAHSEDSPTSAGIPGPEDPAPAPQIIPTWEKR